MTINKKVGTLGIITALLVAIVRHGVTTKWGRWDSWTTFFASWFIHWIALFLLIAVASELSVNFHRYFMDDDPKRPPELPYYVTMTVLVATLAIGFLSFAGPFGSDDY